MKNSFSLEDTFSSIRHQVLSSLDQNVWTDLLYQLHPRMNEIIIQSDKKSQFKCLVCQKHRTSHIGASLKYLPKHFTVAYHIDNLRKELLSSVNKEIVELFGMSEERIFDIEEDDYELREKPGNNRSPTNKMGHNESIEEIKLKFLITQFILFKRLPFNISSDLIELIQGIVLSYSKNTILKCHINRNEVVDISRKCISKSIKEKLFEELKASPISLLVDAGSDYYGTTYLSICVRFLEKNNRKQPGTKLLTIIPLEEDSTGESLFNDIKKTVLKDEILQTNLMAICTDQGSNMAGPESGLGKLLQSEFPHILAVNDLSHIYNLICKKAVPTFPKMIVEMVKYISSYFKRSNQKKAAFKKFQESKGSQNPLEVLSFSEVRWLSLTQCLERILRLWKFLKEHFTQHGEDEEKNFFSVENEFYARNLLILLEQLTHYNKIFQVQNMRYDDMLFNMNESLSVLVNEIVISEERGKTVQHYLSFPWEKEEEIQKYLIDIRDFEEEWIATYPELKELLDNLDPNTINLVFITTRKFIIKVLCEMKTRLPFNEKVFQSSLGVYFYSEIFDMNAWQSLAERFRNIITEDKNRQFQNELKRISCNYSRHVKEHINSSRTILETWDVLSNQYPLLGKLAKSILVLPHSSCPVERVFSQMEDFITPKRNRLTAENLEACLLIHQTQDYEGYDFEMTQQMLINYQNLGNEEGKTQLNVINQKDEATMQEEKTDQHIEVIPPEKNVINRNPEVLKEDLAALISSLFLKTPEREELPFTQILAPKTEQGKAETTQQMVENTMEEEKQNSKKDSTKKESKRGIKKKDPQPSERAETLQDPTDKRVKRSYTRKTVSKDQNSSIKKRVR